MSQAAPSTTASAAGAPGRRASRAPAEAIVVRGAREHNLRDLDVRIPRGRLVVITGLSGSGKSSLAFDTIYAEGQRRYVESLSTYARQFLDQMVKPDVESIEGLSPAISIEQKTVSASPRSTVGTVTEVSDYLRLLYARVGDPHCPGCGEPISSQTPQKMSERVLAAGEGARVLVTAPIVRGRKGVYRKELEKLRKKGFVRARIDGRMVDLGDDPKLERQVRHDIDVVVDRLVVKPAVRGRLVESVETALGLADGFVKVEVERDGAAAEHWLLSAHGACASCGISLPEIAPRMFSFNNPHGACPDCAGLGERFVLDPERIVPDPTLALGDGAIEPWHTALSGRARRGRKTRAQARYYEKLLAAVASHFGVGLDTPWSELPARARKGILYGSAADEISFELGRPRAKDGKTETVRRSWDGVCGELERRAKSDEKVWGRLRRYRSPQPCTTCDGARLRVEARHVTVGGRGIHELSRLSIRQLTAFLDSLEIDSARGAVADRLLEEIRERLHFLDQVGLDYLSLDRPSSTLSGGEGQRIRLAAQIGSSLMGVLYILDEPSIGLHARDHGRLLASLARLRDMGNSILVVEHDESTIRAADWVIDLGPGAGIHGGELVAEGPPARIASSERSLTGSYLSGQRAIRRPTARRKPGPRALVITECRQHNLANISLRVPLGLLTVVTGVSGSGKSTLVNDTLHRALASRLYGASSPPGRFGKLEGLEYVDKVVDVDQSPIGRTPRSNPATYCGVFDGIRALFSQVPEARVRGYDPGRFSFNVKGGRCEACKGDGLLRVEMHFLPDLFVTCEVCRGRRYNRETLEVTYKGKTIADVLDTTVEEALALFENFEAVRRPLQTLSDVGLGYVHLGQPATTLSGGEAQRVKLAKELARRSTGRTLYLLDEPTTGLHFADVEKLLELLHRLVELGNTVVVIEHHLDVIASADRVIDLGPEGGTEGGEIVAEGTPEEVAAAPRSHTGRALARVLAKG